MMFVIEQNIPIPPRWRSGGGRNSGKAKYPWHQLGIGESFFVPGITTQKLSACANHIHGKKFTFRAMRRYVMFGEEGVRAWRIR